MKIHCKRTRDQARPQTELRSPSPGQTQSRRFSPGMDLGVVSNLSSKWSSNFQSKAVPKALLDILCGERIWSWRPWDNSHGTSKGDFVFWTTAAGQESWAGMEDNLIHQVRGCCGWSRILKSFLSFSESKIYTPNQDITRGTQIFVLQLLTPMKWNGPSSGQTRPTTVQNSTAQCPIYSPVTWHTRNTHCTRNNRILHSLPAAYIDFL
jgi:hypothetical protein